MANENQEVDQVAEPKANLAMTDQGFMPTDIEGVYRQANLISKSDFAMPMYKANEANCMILLEVSIRLHVPWMMLMQHMYIIHERPALDATITTALVNQSGVFTDPIEYEVEGKEARDKDYRVRAYATRKSTGTVLYGPWIDWSLVRGEAWDAKSGSKWKSMPDQMFHYRAASWFQRRYCPELTMGMMTTDEVLDMPRKQVNSKTVDEDKSTAERIKDRFDKPETTKETETEKPDEKPKTKTKAEKDRDARVKKKAKLAAAEAKAKSEKEKSEQKPETTSAPPPETEEPKLVKCPICSEEVDPKIQHDCSEPGDTQTTTTAEPEQKDEVLPDKWKCMRCGRLLKDTIEDVKNGLCAHCTGKIAELA